MPMKAKVTPEHEPRGDNAGIESPRYNTAPDESGFQKAIHRSLRPIDGA